jgi:hypothetical protein
MTGLLINGVDSETLGFTLAEAPGWLDAPARQTATANVAGRPGVTQLADPVEQPRRMTLRGTLRASSWQLARSRLDTLKLAFMAKPLKLTFADNPTRYVVATLDSFPATVPQGAIGAFVQENLQLDIALTANDPLSYDTDEAGVLLWYAPGDTIAGETFTRSTVAQYRNANGEIVTAGINVKRDNHYINLVRSLLLEDTRTNICLQSQVLGTTWAPSAATIASDVTASPSTAINADKLQEDNTNNTHAVVQAITCALRRSDLQHLGESCRANKMRCLHVRSHDRERLDRRGPDERLDLRQRARGWELDRNLRSRRVMGE